MLRLSPLLVALSLLCASNARAEWWVQSPPDTCMEREELVALIINMVPRETLMEGPRRTARIELSPEEGLVSILVAREGVTLGARELRVGSADCAELAEAAAFVVATLIEGGVGLSETTEALPTGEGATQLAPPSDFANVPPEVEAVSPDAEEADGGDASEQGPAPAEGADELGSVHREAAAETATDTTAEVSSERRLVEREPLARELLFAAGGVFRTGAEPSYGLGPRLSFSVRRARLRVALHGAYFRRTLDLGARQLVVNAGEIGARACAGHAELRPWRLEGCVGVDLGFSSGQGIGFDENAKTRLTSVGLAAELNVRFTHQRFIGRAGVGGIGRLQRVRFTRQSATGNVDAFRQSPASFSAFLEIGVRLDWSRT